MVGIPERERNSVFAVFNQQSAAESVIEEMMKAGLDARKVVVARREEGFSAFQAMVDSLDISRDRVVRLEAMIIEGKTVLVTHGNDHEAQRAFTLLVNSGAEDVHFHRPSGETARRAA
jgi:hypothetical protein